MRRGVLAGLVTLGLVGIGAATGVASAAVRRGPAVSPRAVALAAAAPVCKIKDERLDKISGLAATGTGYAVVNESPDASQRRVFFLNSECKLDDTVDFPRAPRDPEDLAVSPDGKTLWIADIGDEGKERSSIAVWTMPASGSGKLVIHRLSYPDGTARNAEALLIDGDGLPIIVTREAKAGIYKPSAALKSNNTAPVPLRKVGDMPTLPRTTTPNGLGPPGRTVITGGAVAPRGGRVVLRTYADAFEWDVTNGDVTAALLSGKPRITPLPDEPAGEAITYSADGAKLLTVSETAQLKPEQLPEILSYVPGTETTVKQAAGHDAAGGNKQPAWYNRLSLSDYTYLIGAVGALGLILVIAGVIGILLARRRPAKPATAPVSPPVGAIATSGGEVGPDNTPTAVMTVVREESPVYGAPSRESAPVYGGGTYRGGQPAAAPPAPPVPHAPPGSVPHAPPGPERRPPGRTYGSGGGQYGSRPSGPQGQHGSGAQYHAGPVGPADPAPANGRQPQAGYGGGMPPNHY